MFKLMNLFLPPKTQMPELPVTLPELPENFRFLLVSSGLEKDRKWVMRLLSSIYTDSSGFLLSLAFFPGAVKLSYYRLLHYRAGQGQAQPLQSLSPGKSQEALLCGTNAY